MSLGIYFHIPFCRSKCNYCHFIRIPFDEVTAERYQKCVLREVKIAAATMESGESSEVDSIYFGGGTPSLVPAEHIAGIIGECKERYRVAADCEVSMEANPGTISVEKTASLRKAGVNRVSLGAQSFVDKELISLGRTHDAAMIRQSLKRLRENGFENLNLDLLLGLPHQTRETWLHSLQAAAALAVDHISVYMLDLDQPCELATLAAGGLAPLPEEDLISDLYLETIDFLCRRGYAQYEISNFARPGCSCRHNLKYWKREPVYGFGLGSHSFDRRCRYSNSEDIQGYFQKVETGLSPVRRRYPISAAQALGETLFLGLRLTEGVDWNHLQSVFGKDKLAGYADSLRGLSAKGWIEWRGSKLRLTARGMLLSNEIFQLFV